MWVTNYVVFAFWGIVSEKIAYYYRLNYLRAIMRQEPEWYESFDILELPSRISKECLAIQSGTSEKFALILQGLAMSMAGFAVAFLISWKFALICLGVFPFLLAGIVVMGVLMKAGFAN